MRARLWTGSNPEAGCRWAVMVLSAQGPSPLTRVRFTNALYWKAGLSCTRAGNPGRRAATLTPGCVATFPNPPGGSGCSSERHYGLLSPDSVKKIRGGVLWPGHPCLGTPAVTREGRLALRPPSRLARGFDELGYRARTRDFRTLSHLEQEDNKEQAGLTELLGSGSLLPRQRGADDGPASCCADGSTQQLLWRSLFVSPLSSLKLYAPARTRGLRSRASRATRLPLRLNAFAAASLIALVKDPLTQGGTRGRDTGNEPSEATRELRRGPSGAPSSSSLTFARPH